MQKNTFLDMYQVTCKTTTNTVMEISLHFSERNRFMLDEMIYTLWIKIDKKKLRLYYFKNMANFKSFCKHKPLISEDCSHEKWLVKTKNILNYMCALQHHLCTSKCLWTQHCVIHFVIVSEISVFFCKKINKYALGYMCKHGKERQKDFWNSF